MRAVLAAAALLASAGAAVAATAVIRGTASYDLEEALPAGATLEVELLDVSRADAKSERIAEVSAEVRRRGAVPFVLTYDPAAIDPARRYSLAAKIVADGKTLFRSDTAHPVLTGGAGNIAAIPMISLFAPRSPQAAGGGGPDPAALAGTWTLEEIGGVPRSAGVATFIILGADGEARGRGGCNSFSGDYAVTDGVLTIGPLAATRMACPPPAMEQEARFFAALEAARGFRIEKGDLVLIDADGRRLARLDRQA